MKDIIIKAENLVFSYDDGQTKSLDDFSVEIERGRKIAVLGANGAGKSTFFLCLNGIHKPVSGKIFIDGKEVSYKKDELMELRRKVGIVFQDPDNQLFSASVFQEISFGALNMGMSEQEARKEVEDVIEVLEIQPFQHKPVHALSGGQKKQVSIADVVVMKPEVIIFDEPASSLDPKHTEIVNGIIDILSERGITILISTHNVDYALEWADECIVVHKGRVIKQGTPLDIFDDMEILEKTNLKKPAVLEMFQSLVDKGILSKELTPPKNLHELEEYISAV